MTPDPMRTADRRAAWATGLAWVYLAFVPLMVPYTLWDELTGEVHHLGFWIGASGEQPAGNILMTYIPILGVAAYFGFLLAFMMWTYRAAAVARTLGAGDISPGWAVGWYFVPVALLWKPYQALRRIWAVSLDPAAPDTARLPGLFRLFWTVSVVSVLVSSFSARLELRAAGTPDYREVALFGLFALAVEAAMVFAAIRVIGAVTAAQARTGHAEVFR